MRPKTPRATRRGQTGNAAERAQPATSEEVAHTRRLGIPRLVAVTADANGRPSAVDGRAVASVRESWLLEDRWWTERPLQRRYWEVVTVNGRDEVVFHDLRRGSWWRQRA